MAITFKRSFSTIPTMPIMLRVPISKAKMLCSSSLDLLFAAISTPLNKMDDLEYNSVPNINKGFLMILLQVLSGVKGSVTVS